MMLGLGPGLLLDLSGMSWSLHAERLNVQIVQIIPAPSLALGSRSTIVVTLARSVRTREATCLADDLAVQSLSLIRPAERCRSGRTDLLAKQATGVNLVRGFESLPLRQMLVVPA